MAMLNNQRVPTTVAILHISFFGTSVNFMEDHNAQHFTLVSVLSHFEFSPNGWLKPYNGMFTSYQLVLRISLAHLKFIEVDGFVGPFGRWATATKTSDPSDRGMIMGRSWDICSKNCDLMWFNHLKMMINGIFGGENRLYHGNIIGIWWDITGYYHLANCFAILGCRREWQFHGM